MDAAAELGRSPVRKHQIQPEYGDEQADAGRDCANPSRETKFSGANAYRHTSIFPVQLTTSRVGNLTRLIHVCVFSSHSFWTSSSLDVPAGVTQEEGHTGFLIHLPSAVRALIIPARRIQPFLSLVDRKVEFCVLTI